MCWTSSADQVRDRECTSRECKVDTVRSDLKKIRSKVDELKEQRAPQ